MLEAGLLNSFLYWLIGIPRKLELVISSRLFLEADCEDDGESLDLSSFLLIWLGSLLFLESICAIPCEKRLTSLVLGLLFLELVLSFSLSRTSCSFFFSSFSFSSSMFCFYCMRWSFSSFHFVLSFSMSNII